MDMDLSHLDAHWQQIVVSFFDSPQGRHLTAFLTAAQASGESLLPPQQQWFEALRLTPFDRVSVVILGQDPYHGIGQAHGLAFSVQPDIPIPPSLKNIFQAIRNDLGGALPRQGCLTQWAGQGVLLLNTLLTVAQGKPLSHRKQGWEVLTDQLIQAISAERSAVVFMLWGKDAQKKASLIDHNKHLVLQSAHPSPLSAYRGFLQCQHFSQANVYLSDHHKRPINWAVD